MQRLPDKLPMESKEPVFDKAGRQALQPRIGTAFKGITGSAPNDANKVGKVQLTLLHPATKPKRRNEKAGGKPPAFSCLPAPENTISCGLPKRGPVFLRFSPENGRCPGQNPVV